MKINKLEIENVKRVKAVKIEPTANGLTVIGGKNNQGKTSVLDSIAWALGGDRYKPAQAHREGSVIPPSLHIVMDNGLVVERKGKNSSLKVIDPEGQKGGQQLLNEFVADLAIDLPKFMESSSKEKANTLLQIIGVGDQLFELERQEQEVYNKRHTIGQIADQKKKFAKEQPYYPDAPKEPISASDLIKQQQDILARNGENQRKRTQLQEFTQQEATVRQNIANTKKEIARLQDILATQNAEWQFIINNLADAQKTAEMLHDESTEALEASIQNIETINIKVRANLDKDKAEEDAKDYSSQYDTFSVEIDQIRNKKMDLLTNANLPLPGLSVMDGELTYNGFKWESLSGSDQLKVATAIVRKLNPKCGFVLLDKLEQMDLDTLKEFGEWLEAEGLQAIATRVSTGEECQIIIDDGYSVTTNQYQATEDQLAQESQLERESQPTWKAGEF